MIQLPDWLKDYQKNTLNIISDFFEKAQSVSATDAYMKATGSEDVKKRLGKLRKYIEVGGAVKVPTVAVKVPTGGGKTIIAVEAIRVIGEAYGLSHPFVLWFTPSDTICKQTVEALKKATHPYRKALDSVFGGRVKVFGIDEKFTITQSDIDGNVCIVVTTAQAFVHQAHEKYNVYRNNEHLQDCMDGCVLEDGMEPLDNDPTKPKFSFANLIIRQHPLMIVDEAHKFMAKLSKETLEGLRPRAVLELTATPTINNNLLYNVRASELYDEEMVKLPIDLVPFTNDWSQCVLAAIEKRDALEAVASKAVADGDGKYLRPILLFQASKVDGEVPVETLKKFLIEQANRPVNQIAVVTGEQKELDGVDVNDPNCEIRYVITVQALKEGWDCPSAYVLCSVANVHSNTDTVQLLGRVMRQPQAKRREAAELNRAYAFVMSPTFNAAADDLVSGLRERGFDSDEAIAAILLKASVNEDLPLFQDLNKVKLSVDEAKAVIDALPRSVDVVTLPDGGAEISVPDNAPVSVQTAAITALSNAGLNEKAQELAVKVQKKKKAKDEAAPCKQGGFALPMLCAEVQGELVFDADGAYGVLNIDVAAFLPSTLTETEFSVGDSTTQGVQLTLNGDRIVFKPSENPAQMYASGFSGALQEANVVNALDAITLTPYLKQAEKRHWITGVVHDLVSVRGCATDRIYCCRYHLKRVLQDKIEFAYQTAKKKAYQSIFDFSQNTIPLKLEFEQSFEFNDKLYEYDIPFMRFYGGGNYQFVKHFLGPNRIPAFDGKDDGEEYQCAVAIDQSPKVKTWLRNADRRPGSFRLPLAEHWFYPDFVGVLNDGRMFVVEYKGADRKSNADTIEKDAIGRLWASKSNGKCLYRTVFKVDAGKDVIQQLNELFA